MREARGGGRWAWLGCVWARARRVQSHRQWTSVGRSGDGTELRTEPRPGSGFHIGLIRPPRLSQGSVRERLECPWAHPLSPGCKGQFSCCLHTGARYLRAGQRRLSCYLGFYRLTQLSAHIGWGTAIENVAPCSPDRNLGPANPPPHLGRKGGCVMSQGPGSQRSGFHHQMLTQAELAGAGSLPNLLPCLLRRRAHLGLSESFLLIVINE